MVADDDNLVLDSSWIEKLEDYDSIKIGYSGGLDSTVLLHKLASIPTLTNKILAVHVNHGLSNDAELWQAHCEDYCLSIGVPIVVSRVNIPHDANIEERARNARYKIFKSLISNNDCLVVAHHRDDQAETLLLHLLRGSGVDGLSAMLPNRKLGYGDLLRPFLKTSKVTLEKYAKSNNLTWINDDSNNSLKHSRNYIRHKVMPVLCEKWPNAVNNIAECAEKCDDAKVNLDALAIIDCCDLKDNNSQLSLDNLPVNDKPRMINILRVWLKKNNILSPSSRVFDKIVNDVIFARQDANPYLSWKKTVIRRYRNTLFVSAKEELNQENVVWDKFPLPVSLDYGLCLSATPANSGVLVSPNSIVEIRFRSGGEVIQQNGHSKKLKKVFQDLEICPWQRNLIPLIYVDNTLKEVVGYVLADSHSTVGTIYKISIDSAI
ncbi:MAG: tRNA lysidine(34) synthetase TilS [Legionellaceae bacterium]|nr:tRNA lysidine(34) synthetase TilS [Legionellaceae bacterium]